MKDDSLERLEKTGATPRLGVALLEIVTNIRDGWRQLGQVASKNLANLTHIELAQNLKLGKTEVGQNEVSKKVPTTSREALPKDQKQFNLVKLQ